MTENTYTVVIAEDEKLLLDDLVQSVEEAGLGFKVIGQAQTGTQALELVNELSPNLVISDINMPMMDGVTFLEQVYDYSPSTRMIIISGYADFEYAQRAIHIKVSDYLLKPVDPNKLYEALLNVRTSLDRVRDTFSRFFDEAALRNNPETIAITLKSYIQSHYQEEINLNLIAQQLNYSLAWLTKLFNQYFETTPLKYLINLRIAKAKSLLLHNPELSVRQVGESVGYDDQGYFSRIFKKYTGLSPADYRESANRLK